MKASFRVLIIGIFILVTGILLFCGFSIANRSQLGEDATAYPLFLHGCELWHMRKIHSATLVMACPHGDLIRIYPFPITAPWYEPDSVPDSRETQQHPSQPEKVCCKSL